MSDEKVMPRIGIYQKDHKILRNQRDARVHLSKVGIVPQLYSLEHFEAMIEDQGQTSSCIGHGTSQGVYTSFAAAGRPLPFVPSPKVIYDLARILNRVSPADALTDSGAMPAFAMSALGGFGVTAQEMVLTPDGRNSDVTPENVNQEPSFLELETSGLKLVTGEFRVDETSSSFTQQICAAISGAAGKPPCAVGIGAFVDTAHFMAYDGHSPITQIDTSDPNGGGHWFTISYYYTTQTLGVVFGGPNSWGAGWGLNGHFEVTAKCLQPVCSDCYLYTAGGVS